MFFDRLKFKPDVPLHGNPYATAGATPTKASGWSRTPLN